MIRRVAPGLLLCALIALAAWGVEAGQRHLLGRPWLDALLIAILLGAAVRAVWVPPRRMSSGVALAAKPVLEVAIVLLGLTLDVPALLRAGPTLLVAIVIAVVAAYVAAYAIARALGVAPRLAALVAIGNAICGNSAIAAAAPVVGAEADDVAAAIAFTAVLGVVVVLLLPLAGAALRLDDFQYGVVAGLTVYAVPQVLAAALPVSALSADVGTLVKLTRVLLLGPALVALGIWARAALRQGAGQGSHAATRPPVIPWFIAGFLVLAAARGAGLVPGDIIEPVRTVSKVLTIVALAALGLGVDVRDVRRVGASVGAAAIGGVLVLFAVAVGMALTLTVKGEG